MLKKCTALWREAHFEVKIVKKWWSWNFVFSLIFSFLPTYPELVGGSRCRLVVLAMEVGGRWSQEAADFIRLLAQARSRSVVPALRQAAVQASIARWSAMLTLAAQAPFAASLILQDPASQAALDGDIPPLSTLLEQHPGTPSPASRLPLRP